MRCVVIVIVALSAAAACGDVNTALERSVEARQASSDLLAQFTKAADAANRAVMANTDERSVAFAREAEAAKEKVLKDVAALEPILRDLRYTDEAQLLQEFGTRFDEYRALDRRILDLAVENTNVRSLALSLDKKRKLIEPCEESLRALQDALAKRGYPKGR